MAMSNRRPPLSNIPNGTNSPCRVAAVTAAGLAFSKRLRAPGNVANDMSVAEGPPAKRPMLSKEGVVYPPSPSRRQDDQRQQQKQNKQSQQQNLRHHPLTQQSRQTHSHRVPQEADVFARRTRASHTLTGLDKKLFDAREKSRRAAEEKMAQEKLDDVRQWQRHYRKAFPGFVFYFESVPHEVRSKCSKQVNSLAAAEVKFFSKEVTHVVTTRPMPAESEATTSNGSTAPSDSTSQTLRAPPRTINPSLLDRTSRTASVPMQAAAQALEGSKPPTNGRINLSGTHVDLRKQQGTSGSVDLLVRAKDLGIKIWALEKFQRMMAAMFETDGGALPQHAYYTRGSAAEANNGLAEKSRESSLAQLLRNERRNGPADRDRTVLTREIVPFRGPFVYVHDMDEKIRPIMVREYPKVERREDGVWPQFHSVHEGRCPFIDDAQQSRRHEEKRRVAEQHDERQKRGEQQPPVKADDNVASRTRAAVAGAGAQEPATAMQPPARTTDVKRQTAAARDENVKPTPAAPIEESQAGEDEVKTIERPQLPAVARGRSEAAPTIPRSSFPPGFTFTGECSVGGEPMASGVQPSNITSAIRSQMVSSTAATAPGAKAGTNKEVLSLKRKILENRGGAGVNSMAAPAAPPAYDAYVDTEATTAPLMVGHAAHQRITRTTAAKEEPVRPKQVVEDKVQAAGPEHTVPTTAAAAVPSRTTRVRPTKVERDLRPGYCENCRDKFDDFETHIVSREHRRFALNQKNWAELDSLLSRLHRDELEM